MLALIVGVVLVGQAVIWIASAVLFLLGLRFVYRFVTAPEGSPRPRFIGARVRRPVTVVVQAPPPQMDAAQPVTPDTAPDQPDRTEQAAGADESPPFDADSMEVIANPFKPIQHLEEARISAALGTLVAGLLTLLSLIGLAMLVSVGESGAIAALANFVLLLITVYCGWRTLKQPPSRIAATILAILAFVQTASLVYAMTHGQMSWISKLLFTVAGVAFLFSLASVRGAVWYHRILRRTAVSPVYTQAAPSSDAAGMSAAGPVSTVTSTQDPGFFSLPLGQRAKIAWGEQRGWRRAMRKRNMAYFAALVVGFALIVGYFLIKIALDGPPATVADQSEQTTTSSTTNTTAQPPAAAPVTAPAPAPAPATTTSATAPIDYQDVIPGPDGSTPPQALVTAWGQNEETCRGSDNPDAPDTQAACSVRDNASAQLNKLGWCHGRGDEAEAAFRWQRCAPGTNGYKDSPEGKGTP